MEDEDFVDATQEGIKRLGFKPQKEVVYNRVLHYSDELDEEAKLWLAEIKANLGRAVMLREVGPVCAFWSSRLSKFIEIHGLKFSKEDHVTFIHLMYELLIIPNLETFYIDKFAHILYTLIKKRYLLTPDDLILEWRPLYDLCKRVVSSYQDFYGLHRHFSSLGQTLGTVVQKARFYFPETATQEILAEIKPQLSPHANLPVVAGFLKWFLPVALPPEKAHMGFKLWFDDLMELWLKGKSSSLSSDIMWQLAFLASQNIGYIDWEPYIPLMFTRFLHLFNLPVTYKQQQSPKFKKLETSAISLWIVSVLGGGSSCQMHLDKFLKTIESYFHPANFGVWFIRLKELLRKLPETFVERLYRERYKETSWTHRTPDSHKLTEEDIDRFVEGMSGIARQAVYSKLGCVDVSVALQNLAVLRPKMIIPVLVERLYSSLDSLTEPHKLTSIMQCIVAVAQPMVEGAKKGYPEGPTHVIPMLMLTLPGIDANDFRKCVVTFQFISMFVSLIPIVDSSKASEYHNDLTEEEEVICAATANFEDFVAQFFDRIFNFIESSTLETTRMEKDMEERSKAETLAESALSAVCYTLLSQCSTDIFRMALKKLHTFVTERILETKVAGRYLASLCRKFSRVNPEETLKCLVPHLCNNIMSLTESPEIQKEEILDKELLYNMLILSYLLGTRRGTLPYVTQILAVLDRTLHLSCREGYKIASKILNHLLISLTSTCPTDHRSVNISYDLHVKDYLPVRDWGKKYNDYRELNLEWHVPGEEELECVRQIVAKYLPPELERLEKHMSDEKPLTREELCCSLKIILGILGGQQVFPQWDEEPISLVRTTLTTSTCFPLSLGVKGEVNLPDGSNVRYVIAHAMDRLQVKMLACTEDDTKSLFTLIQILEILMLNKPHCGSDFERLCKNFQMVKKVLTDPLLGKKSHVRVLMIDRVVLHHEGRRVKAVPPFTPTHKLMLLNLLRLSCSFYSQVRIRAQAILFQALEYHTHSYLVLLPPLLDNLQQDAVQFHEQFKGSLYVLLGPKMTPIITMHNWDVFSKIWPAIIKSRPSGKFSIITLLDSIVKNVLKHLSTLTLEHEVPDRCVEKAKLLWNSEPMPAGNIPTREEMDEGISTLTERNKRDLEQYYIALDAVMDAIEESNIHWRYYEMGIRFLRDLVHPDAKFPARAVKIFLYTLINDSLKLRKIAVTSTLNLLRQQKRQQKKIEADLEKLAGGPVPENPPPGIRPDNMWLQYNSKTCPKTTEAWDEPRFLHKPNIGYFQWPRNLQVHASYSEQPPLDRNDEELSPEEREIRKFFLSTENVDKLVKYFSLEDKKGKDEFDGPKFFMFEYLCKNHGDIFVDMFKPHLEKLVIDKHESSQRCAAEIIAGLIRGAKHWPFEKVSRLWEFLGPLIRTALANMTEETIYDWGVCFASAAEKGDPNRLHWLMEVLMEDPLRKESSYLNCGRLYVLHGVLNQHKWRVSELNSRLLEYLRSYLTHPFQNVRDMIGSVLSSVFQPDMKMFNAKTLGPYVKEFMADITKEVEPLYALAFNHQNNKSGEPCSVAVNEIAGQLDNVQISDGGADDCNSARKSITSIEKDVCIRLFKTVCRWITGSLSRSQSDVRPEYYSIFPLLCLLESYDQDDEIGKICSGTIAALARSATNPEDVPLVFSSIWKVARSGSWWAKSSVVEFLQVFIFHNMFTVLNSSEWADEATKIVLELLEDERLEVREKAAEVLGGFLHCDFIADTGALLSYFKKKAKTKIRNSRKNIRIRHSGILGLCSYINSSPYDVPDCVPEIFFILGSHLNDPQPIPATIRKTLNDFKRTHHDNWKDHQLRFTEKELEVLNDLIVPPSYYA